MQLNDGEKRTAGRSPRWGLLAASNIAKKFAFDLRGQGLNLAAVASRDFERAKTFALELGIPGYYAGYEALLQDPDVDIVYISLPNHLHAEWSARAAEAGKHVLCEKPGALDERECRQVLDAAEKAGVFYMEGFMYRCHPLWAMAAKLLEEGHIGRLRKLRSSFCFDMGSKPLNIRQARGTGGGALLDVGSYCLSFSRLMAREEPLVCEARSQIGPDTGVDEWTSARLEFPSGVTAEFTCAIRKSEPHAAIIYGEKGRIEIPSPWHPKRDRAEIKLILPGEEEKIFYAGDGLSMFGREALRVEEFLNRGQCPDMDWRDSLGQAMALEALRRDAGLITG